MILVRLCPICDRKCKGQGLGVHMQRAHNPQNNYASRKGSRMRYDENNKRTLVAANDLPKIEPIDMLIKNPNLTQWELRALRSREHIMAKHGGPV